MYLLMKSLAEAEVYDGYLGSFAGFEKLLNSSFAGLYV